MKVKPPRVRAGRHRPSRRGAGAPSRGGYFVTADFGGDYRPLAKLFGQGAGSFVPFRPSGLLQEIDAAIPAGYRLPALNDVTRIYGTRLEQADKPYFVDGSTTTSRATASAPRTWTRPGAASGSAYAISTSALTRVRGGQPTRTRRGISLRQELRLTWISCLRRFKSAHRQ